MKMQSPSILYPLTVGVLLGWLQTGLFFQLTFTLSSGFTTYLLVTLSWLAGSALGVYYVQQVRIRLFILLLLMITTYALSSWLVNTYPFNTQLWFVYGILIALAGLYPGVFFARAKAAFTTRKLFFWENNGFISGLILCTVLFMVFGRPILLWIPLVLIVPIAILSTDS